MLCAASSKFIAKIALLAGCIFFSVCLAAAEQLPTEYEVLDLPVDCDDLAGGADLDQYSQWLWFNQMWILHAYVKGDSAKVNQIYKTLEECKYARDTPLRSALADYAKAVIRRHLGDADGAIAGFKELLSEKRLEEAPLEKIAAAVHLYSLLGRNGQEEEAILVLGNLLASMGSNVTPELKFMAAHGVAVASERLGRAVDARRYYELALQFQAESHWASLLWPNLASQLAERRYLFDNFMDFLLNSGDYGSALALAELSQGNLLLDTVKSPQAVARAQRSWLIHYKLIKDLSYERVFARDDVNKERAALLDSVIAEAASQVAKLSTTSNLAQIELPAEESLQATEAFLSSFKPKSGEAYLYLLDLGQFPAAVLLKTRGGLRSVRLSRSAVEFIPELESFSRCLRDASCTDWRRISAELYSNLLGEISGNLTGIRAINVFATGIFRAITFEALVGEKRIPLGVQAEITYSPGIRYLELIRERGRSTPRPALVSVVSGESSPDLKPIEESVLGSRCRGKVFRLASNQQGAGSFELLPSNLSGAELLIVSAHGWFFKQFPLLSGFEVVGNNREKGFLPSFKLGLLDYSSSLTVLSSCQLGLTYLNSFGEGFFPPVVFLAAGSDAVLAISGDVPTQSTDHLVSMFLKYYGRRATAAKALWRARKKIWKNEGRERHPIHWSLLSLFGRGDKTLCD